MLKQKGSAKYMKKKVNIFKILLLVFQLSLIATLSLYSYQNSLLETDKNGKRNFEVLFSGIQSISKLALESKELDISMQVRVENAALKYTQIDKTFATNKEIRNRIDAFFIKSEEFEEAMLNFYDTDDGVKLFLVSSENHEEATSILEDIDLHIDEMEEFIRELRLIISIQIATIVLSLLVFITKYIAKNKKKNDELKKTKYTDVFTGLYNDVKCQEIINSQNIRNGEKERAILFFSIDGVEEIKEAEGEMFSNELIYSFAKQLENATKISNEEMFVGRYNKDEFLVLFSADNESDIKLYIEELNFFIDKFNTTEKKIFKIKFFVGHIITNEKMKEFTTKALFDIAEQNMRTNKIAMKEAEKRDLAENIEN